MLILLPPFCGSRKGRWQIAGGQSVELLRVRDSAVRLWYTEAALEQGWSRPILAAQMDTGLHERQGRAVTNFERVLPPASSNLAQQVLNDRSKFDFLSLEVAVRERDLERALVARVKDLLLELGKGFCFLAALDDLDREPGDNPRIGLILCREHNRIVVEYALRHVDAPIGVDRYRLLGANALLEALAAALPIPRKLEPGILSCEGPDAT